TFLYHLGVAPRRNLPARSFLDYALYVTFFPHLVSGPIVRASELVPQFETPRRATAGHTGWGAALRRGTARLGARAGQARAVREGGRRRRAARAGGGPGVRARADRHRRRV